MRFLRGSGVVIAVLGLSLAFAQASGTPSAQAHAQPPMYFERNMGQADARVEFLARSPNLTLFLTGNEAVLALHRPVTSPATASMDVLRLKFVGSSGHASLTGMDQLNSRSSYFTSSALRDGVTNVPHYARVRYADIYEDIDAIFYGDQHQIEYDFIVRPGGDPGEIRLAFEGSTRLSLDSDGSLVVGTARGQIVQQPPRVYQESDGERQEVAARYVLRSKGRIGFQIGPYNHAQPLIIDPVVAYSTYMGGTGDNQPGAFAVDAAGNAYVAGSYYGLMTYPTTAGSLETACPPPRTAPYCSAAFVSKFRPDGSLEYSTYLGGDGARISAIQADATGDAYVLGQDPYRSIPTTSACLPSTTDPCGDSFLVKLNPTGSSILHAGYLFVGGPQYGPSAAASTMALDPAGAVYLAGTNTSPNFPATPGAYQAILHGGMDLFVAKIAPTLDQLIYATLLGGSGGEYSFGINYYNTSVSTGLAVDVAGNAYVAGRTTSWDFPVVNPLFSTCSADDPGATACANAFVSKLDPAGTSLVYSTYLNSRSDPAWTVVALSAEGDGHVALSTRPAAAWEQTPSVLGSSDGWHSIIKLDPAGSLVFHIRPPRGLTVLGVETTDTGEIYLTGSANCGVSLPCWPATPDASQPSMGGRPDAFVARLSPLADELRYFSFWGGNGIDHGIWVRTDPSGAVHLAGVTDSQVCPFTPETNDFPTRNAAQSTFASGFCTFAVWGNDYAGTPWQIDCSSGQALIDDLPVNCHSGSVFLMKTMPGENTPAGTGVAVTPIDGIDISFGDVTAPGTTSVTRTDTAPPLPAGFLLGDPAKYYEISTTAAYSGSIQVCIDYTGVSYVAEPGLRLMHYQDGAWQDCTTSLDTAGNIICGSVTSLSPFAVARPPMPPLQPEGFLAPLAALVPEGSPIPYPDKAFKLGRTLPLKFVLRADGTVLTDADISKAPRLTTLAKAGEPPLNLDTLDLDSGQANDSSRLFRYADGAWTYNLSTRNLTAGSYTITISLPDGGRFVGGIVLK